MLALDFTLGPSFNLSRCSFYGQVIDGELDCPVVSNHNEKERIAGYEIDEEDGDMDPICLTL